MIVRKYLVWLTTNSSLFIYCVIILYAAAGSLKKPAYNWDILPYMGVVLSYEKTDAKVIHSEVYAIAKEQVPTLYYNRLVDPSNTYRNSIAQSPEIFHSQYPFYMVKPLYTMAAYCFYKAGAALPVATVWPSVIAYCITAVLFFSWLKKYWPGLYACTGSLLVMLSPPLLTVAGLSTPDALSGLLVFSALYFLVEKKSMTGTFVFLLLSIFARLDNILPAIFFLSIIFFSNKWKTKVRSGKILMLFGILLMAYLAVSANVRSFGWSVLYYPDFVKQLNASYTAHNEFDFNGYISLARAQATTGLYFSFVSMFLFLVLLLLWHPAAFKYRHYTIEQITAVSFVAIILIRFILQPLVADRIYVPYYLSVIAFLVKKQPLTASHQPLY